MQEPIPFLIPTTTEGVYEMHVDNSSKELFETCARAAQYYTVARRELATDRPALFKGEVTHKALVHRKRAQYFGVTDTAKFEPEQMATIVNMYEGKDFGPDEWRTCEHAVNAIIEYNKAWPIASEPFKIARKKDDAEPLIEWPFKLELGHANMDSWVETHAGKFYVRTVLIFWTGLIDAIIDYGDLFVMEHKTTAMLSQDFFNDFQLGSQGLGYAWAANELDIPVKGIFVDAIAGRKPTKTGKAHEYMRQRIWYDPAQVNEWRVDMFTHCTDFLEHLCRGYFPKSTKWCFGKFKRCQYWDVCTQNPDRRQTILQSDLYRNVTWSPLNTIKYKHENNGANGEEVQSEVTG